MRSSHPPPDLHVATCGHRSPPSALSYRVRRLLQSHWEPEQFHVEKDEIYRELWRQPRKPSDMLHAIADLLIESTEGQQRLINHCN